MEHRPTLGDGPRPAPADIGRAIRLLADVERVLWCAFVAVALVGSGWWGRLGSRFEEGSMSGRFAAPVPGEHGGDGRSLAQALGVPVEEVLDLSASLSPCAPDVASVVARHLDGLRRYPDCADATSALAAAMGVDGSRVLLCNGGAEAIALVASVMPVGSISDPDFSLYRRQLVEEREGAPSWRSDPHNPTGVSVTAEN